MGILILKKIWILELIPAEEKEITDLGLSVPQIPSQPAQTPLLLLINTLSFPAKCKIKSKCGTNWAFKGYI